MMEDTHKKNGVQRESKNVDQSIEEIQLKEEQQNQDVGVGPILSIPSHTNVNKGTSVRGYNPSLRQLDNRINEKVNSQSSKIHKNSVKSNRSMNMPSKTGNKIEHDIEALPENTSCLKDSKSRVATTLTTSSYPRSTTFLQRSILNPYASLGKHVFARAKARNKTNPNKKSEVASVEVKEPDTAVIQAPDHHIKPSGRTAIESAAIQSKRIQQHLESDDPSDKFSCNSVIAHDFEVKPGAYDESGTRLNSNRASHTITDIDRDNIPPDETTCGFQAYAVPTVCDAFNVQVIKNEKELENERKRRYMKNLICLLCIVFVISAIIVIPISLDTGEKVPITTEEPSASPHSAPSSEPTSTAPSLKPTAAPTTFRFIEALDFLLSNNISDLEALFDVESPQGKAIAWISNEDRFRVEIGSDKFMQRYILAVFYFAMDGPNWETVIGELPSDTPRAVDWLSAADECFWEGSICSGGSIREINFAFSPNGYGLEGKFPEELCLLDKISVITLDGNSIGSTIPQCFGNFSELNLLSLENNKLNGPIPQSLLDLPNLQTLRLKMNDLTGIFPPFNSVGTPQLAHLDLAGNSIRGELPESLFDISGLKIVNISGNSITGSLPSNIGQNINYSNGSGKMLEILDVGDNKLYGEIPGSVYNATGMKKLILSWNNLSGQLEPSIFESLLNLVVLNIDNNLFSGQVPESLAIPSLLNALTLHNNNFTGSISGRICLAKDRPFSELRRLKVLTLDCEEVVCRCCDQESNCF